MQDSRQDGCRNEVYSENGLYLGSMCFVCSILIVDFVRGYDSVKNLQKTDVTESVNKFKMSSKCPPKLLFLN